MMREFEAVIYKADCVDETFIKIPFDVNSEYGCNRVKVVAYFDGVQAHSTIVAMGNGYKMGLSKSVRELIKKSSGDTVKVAIEKEPLERKITIPVDFLHVLEDDLGALTYFEELSYEKKKKCIDWITSATKDEMRASRILKAFHLLKDQALLI